jgi:hypothetical protein
MATFWSDPVDLYCERTDPSFWAEPVNALTNAGFLIVAGLALAQWLRQQPRDWPILALIALTGLIGIGSFVFHTVATRGAALFDVVPIGLFVYCYLYLALRRFLRLSLPGALAIMIGFVVLSRGVAAGLPDGFINGSGEYLPPLAALVVVGWMAPRESGRSILLAAAVFAVSLVFRSIDQAICSAFPLGTHFIWHLLNAAVLFILLRAALLGERVGQPR